MESQYFAATAIHAGALQKDDMNLMDLAKRKIPFSIQVGDSDEFFPVKIVRETSDAFKAKGFTVDLIEIPNHDHWYYDQAAKFNQTAWNFLKKYELDVDPFYQKYKWDQ
jgi:pimeloyl-ACP methyl ester carboxylesterase